MRGAELYRNFWAWPSCGVLQSQDFYISINGSYQAFKEGGRIESQKIILGRHKTRKTEVRCQKSDVRFFCFLSSVFCILFSVLVENDPDRPGFWCVAKV